ncbi:hypothetical protein L3X38_025619 [Prunus dulcis]|uniref:Uncharacterized protein n=1 Tax=Prunus dulcis TaxID=3755 RepID=A0AAD4W2T4_PRUDU|nr:hypothetical protein L3X38_025619 [Prunus dulcis]
MASLPLFETPATGHGCGWGRYQNDLGIVLFQPQLAPAYSRHDFAGKWRRSGRCRPIFTAVDLPPPATVSDEPADTSPQLLAVLPPTPPFLVTSDTAAGTSLQLPAPLSLDTCLLSSCRLSFLGLVIDYLGAWLSFPLRP